MILGDIDFQDLDFSEIHAKYGNGVIIARIIYENEPSGFTIKELEKKEDIQIGNAEYKIENKQLIINWSEACTDELLKNLFPLNAKLKIEVSMCDGQNVGVFNGVCIKDYDCSAEYFDAPNEAHSE